MAKYDYTYDIKVYGRDDEPEKVEKLWCGKCHGETNHKFLVAHYVHTTEIVPRGEYGLWCDDWYSVVRCCGCDTVRFSHHYHFSEDRDDEYGFPDTTRLYPEEFKREEGGIRQFTDAIDVWSIPDSVLSLYEETLRAFRVGCFRLAAGGVGAVTEEVCIEQGAKGKELWKKIDGLVQLGFIVRNEHYVGKMSPKDGLPPEGDETVPLHHVRELRNDALHLKRTITKDEVLAGIQIVAWLIDTIYLIPLKGHALRKATPKVSSPGADP